MRIITISMGVIIEMDAYLCQAPNNLYFFKSVSIQLTPLLDGKEKLLSPKTLLDGMGDTQSLNIHWASDHLQK